MNKLAVVKTKELMTPEDVQVLRDSMFRGFNDSEIKFSLAVANQLSLSPLLRQVHFVKRFDSKLKRDVVTPQTGIDGFRLIADRTGKYAGSDEPIFEYLPDDKFKKNPIKATVTVYKLVAGLRVGFTASALFSEYFPGDTVGFMWKSKPHIMLGKCAEAQALRKAFPAELSSVYSDEELEQMDAGERKANSINNKVLGVPQNTETKAEVVSPTPVAEVVPAAASEPEIIPFGEFEKVVGPQPALFDYQIQVGDKYKGKTFGQVDTSELKNYSSGVRAWFLKEKKPIGLGWQEFLDNADKYLKEIGA